MRLQPLIEQAALVLEIGYRHTSKKKYDSSTPSPRPRPRKKCINTLNTLDPLVVHVELARGTHLEPDVLVLERLAAARLAAIIILDDRLLGLAHHLIIIIHGRRAPRLVEPALDAVVRDGVRVRELI